MIDTKKYEFSNICYFSGEATVFIDYDVKVVVTERANHAKDMLQTIPLDNYDGVISVGGDGMFAEVFNGVVIRYNIIIVKLKAFNCIVIS